MLLVTICQKPLNNIILTFLFINLTHFIINLNYFYYEEIIYTGCSFGMFPGSKS